MANIKTILLKFKDSNGSEALEVFNVDFENVVEPITIDYIAFYEKDKNGYNRILKTNTPTGKTEVSE